MVLALAASTSGQFPSGVYLHCLLEHEMGVPVELLLPGQYAAAEYCAIRRNWSSKSFDMPLVTLFKGVSLQEFQCPLGWSQWPSMSPASEHENAVTARSCQSKGIRNAEGGAIWRDGCKENNGGLQEKRGKGGYDFISYRNQGLEKLRGSRYAQGQ